MNRTNCIIWLMLACSLVAKAQTIVRDASDRQPIVQASVYDEQGRIIGVTDTEGQLPKLGDTRRIRLTHIAYQPADAETSAIGNEILMEPISYNTAEVIVEPAKTHCLKLTCYHRRYTVNGKGAGDDVPPIVSFTDGLCELYIFRNYLTPPRTVSLVTRNVISDGTLDQNQAESTPDLELKSLPECHKKSSRLTLSSNERSIHAVYHALKDGEQQEVKLSIRPDGRTGYQKVGNLMMTEDIRNAVYRRSPYPTISQGDLIAYSETKHIEGELERDGYPNYRADLWIFDEFFPISGEFLSRKEYKEEVKSAKHRQTSLTAESIDRMMEELQVPELTAEIQDKLTETKRMYQADYSLQLDEVVKTGKRRQPVRNKGGIRAPRNINEDDPRLQRATSMAQLLAPLGLKVVGRPGEQDLKPVANAASLKIFVDNFEEDDHDDVVNLLPTDVKSVEYFPPNNAENSVFGVRPESGSATVPGVLFIFLKD